MPFYPERTPEMSDENEPSTAEAIVIILLAIGAAGFLILAGLGIVLANLC